MSIMEHIWSSYEKISPLGDTIEIIDTDWTLEKIRTSNSDGKYFLFCSNHVISNRKIVHSLPLDFFTTKKYLKKQWISLVPMVKTNHTNPDGILAKTANAIQKLFVGDAWWMPIYTTDGIRKGEKVKAKRENQSFNRESFHQVPQIKDNVWIMPYQSSFMPKSGEQTFWEETKNELANTFAKESRFPGYDIIPLYMYEDKIGKYYMGVGEPISKEGKKVNDIKIEYLWAMQELKEKVINFVKNHK